MQAEGDNNNDDRARMGRNLWDNLDEDEEDAEPVEAAAGGGGGDAAEDAVMGDGGAVVPVAGAVIGQPRVRLGLSAQPIVTTAVEGGSRLNVLRAVTREAATYVVNGLDWSHADGLGKEAKKDFALFHVKANQPCPAVFADAIGGQQARRTPGYVSGPLHPTASELRNYVAWVLREKAVDLRDHDAWYEEFLASLAPPPVGPRGGPGGHGGGGGGDAPNGGGGDGNDGAGGVGQPKSGWGWLFSNKRGRMG